MSLNINILETRRNHIQLNHHLKFLNEKSFKQNLNNLLITDYLNNKKPNNRNKEINETGKTLI